MEIKFLVEKYDAQEVITSDKVDFIRLSNMGIKSSYIYELNDDLESIPHIYKIALLRKIISGSDYRYLSLDMAITILDDIIFNPEKFKNCDPNDNERSRVICDIWRKWNIKTSEIGLKSKEENDVRLIDCYLDEIIGSRILLVGCFEKNEIEKKFLNLNVVHHLKKDN